MGLSRSRSLTLLVSLLTLTSNTLSSLLFTQLPDDPFHLANNFGWYLHFANILSVFGFIGALRQHPLSIAIFANYLLLDTILCSIPRFLLLGLLNSFSDTLCSSPASFSYTNQQSLEAQEIEGSLGDVSCTSIIGLAQISLVAGVLAATALQFIGALAVREYARGLWVREGLKESLLDADIEGLVKDGEVARFEVEDILERGWEEEKRKREMVEEWGFRGLGVIREVEGEGEK